MSFKFLEPSSKEENGPAPPEYLPPEIDFIPSGNTPEIDLGAPSYDPNLAERRRK